MHLPPALTARFAVLLALAALALSSSARGQDESSPSDLAPDKSPVQTAKSADCPTFRVRPQDQIWVINTRWLGCSAGGAAEPNWAVWRYESGRWENSTTADFYATDSAEIVTAVYIHGNRVDDQNALDDGLAVYFQLVGKLDHEPPVRFVIWSWPSTQIKGQLNDVRVKADRADVEAYYLARFLAGISPEVRVGLLGFSYGARIIAGGLHGLGGGRVVGHTIDPGERAKMRVVFWAAAENSDWLLPGRTHGQALPMAEHWLNLINCCDPALAQYWRVDKCVGGTALGYAGLYGRNLLPADLSARFVEWNVTHLIGKQHSLYPYLYSLPIQNRTRQVVLWHEL
ncbi:MAG: hypothetical protein SFU86_03770 [Pirellulaceae bacterium]|nr:hypothetical protein [Pirellulaceae bacterium]